MVGSAMLEDGYKHPVPLSPQWLATKHTAENKPNGADASTPKASDVDAFNRRGGDQEKKKDWWRTMSPGNGHTERERWREDEREGTVQGRRDRWVEPAAIRDGYEPRRDGKWSNRWGPDEKDKESRREKWDLEKAADRYVPSGRRDGEREVEPRSWTSSLASRAPSALPKPSAPGFGAGRGRGVGTVGFSVGRGRGTTAAGSYSAALNGPIGAQKGTDASTSRFQYPRAKLLDIYRKCGGAAAFGKDPDCSSELTLSSPVDPLAFITPDDVEKDAVESVWKGEVLGDSKDSAGDDPSEVVNEEEKKVVETVGLDLEILDKKELNSSTSLKDEENKVAEKERTSPESLLLLYIDPQGEVQGPFAGADIIQWYEAGYFGIDLLVRASDAPETCQFSPLAIVMPHLVQDRPATLNNLPVNGDKNQAIRTEDELTVYPSRANDDARLDMPVLEDGLVTDSEPRFRVKTESLEQLVHKVEDLELKQFEQLQSARSQMPFPDALHSVHPGLHRTLSDQMLKREISPQREQLPHPILVERGPLPHEIQQLHGPGLAGYEKHMLQGQESRQYLQMMQAEKNKQDQELLVRLLQQKQQQLSRRLLATPQPQERRVSGVWEVDEFGQFQRAQVSNPLQGRLQHQSSLPTVYNHDELAGYGRQGYENQDASRLQQSLIAAEMQKLSRVPLTRNEFAGLSRESIQALLTGNGRPRYETAAWGEQVLQEQRHLNQMLLRDQFVREQLAREQLQQLAREHQQQQLVREQQQILREHQQRELLAREQFAREQLAREHLAREAAREQLAREKQVDHQGLSSQDFILHQLARTQQLNERKVSIDQQVKQVQPSFDNHWAPPSEFGYNWNGIQQSTGFQPPTPIDSAAFKQALPDEFPVDLMENMKLKPVNVDSTLRPRMSSMDTLDASRLIQACEENSSLLATNPKLTADTKMKTGSATNIQEAYFRDITAKANSDFPSLEASVKRPEDVRAFRRWCEAQMKTFTGDSDLTPLQLALSRPSALEAENHLLRCVGDKPESQAFRAEVLRYRELMTPQMMQVFNSGNENVSDNAAAKATDAAATKKKAKKGKKIVDPSLLGFNVVASNRMLMGEIQRFDD